MNLTPTEQERLTIFTAAELARRYRGQGIRLSRPEAIALISDEIITAARRDLDHPALVAFGATVLTAAEVEPGVAATVPFISVEVSMAEGTKLVTVFDPIQPAEGEADAPVPGEILVGDGDIEINAGRPSVTLDVVNTGDRTIQVRSHAHFFEVNRALRFDRGAAFGMRLDCPSGAGVKFEPGVGKSVDLVAFGGARTMRGGGGLTDGPLDDPDTRERALRLARERGYLGAEDG
jgi:urease subunit gamma/beta